MIWVGDAGMTRRLFFALWPDEQTRAALVEVSRLALRVGTGRAVAADNYHLTLAFLGDQSAHQVKRMAVPASVAAPDFELVLDHFGHWSRPQVLWLGPQLCPPGLTALVAQIRAGLDLSGISYDGRDFRPHLTLARKVTAIAELAAPAPVHWRVSSFALVESVTTPTGPVYEVVQQY